MTALTCQNKRNHRKEGWEKSRCYILSKENGVGLDPWGSKELMEGRCEKVFKDQINFPRAPVWAFADKAYLY